MEHLLDINVDGGGNIKDKTSIKKKPIRGYLSTSEPSRPSGRRMCAKLVPSFSVKRMSRGQRNGSLRA
jgi:hypothetical protein